MRRNPARIRPIAIAVSVAMTAAVAVVVLRPSQPSLLAQASRFCSLPSHAVISRWLSERSVVAMLAGKPPSFAIVNVPTTNIRVRMPLSGSATCGGRFIVSPDGTRAIWLWYDGIRMVSLPSGRVARMIDYPVVSDNPPPEKKPIQSSRPQGQSGEIGSTVHEWGCGSAAWADDGNDWVDVESHIAGWSAVCVRDASGRVLQSGSAPLHSHTLRMLRLEGCYHRAFLIGMLPNGNALIGVKPPDPWEEPQSWSQLPWRQGALLEVNVRGPMVAITGQREVKMPLNGRDMSQVLLSPDGRRIAWYFVNDNGFDDDTEQISWTEVAECQLFHRHVVYGKLFISDVDGRNMHEVGRESWTVDIKGEPESAGCWDFQWLPDSRHVSFFHDGAIWMMPA